MSRPISVEVVPSHVHLSEDHHRILFGDRHSGTIRQELSQAGQFAYQETVDVIGPNKEVLTLRVLGPSRRETQVELTPTEAALLQIHALELPSGTKEGAADCILQTAHGSVNANSSVIIPRMHLHLSEGEAKELRVEHGKIVRIDVISDVKHVIEDVYVRVHPTYRARLHMHPDYARELWVGSGAHVRIRDIQH